MFSRSSTFSILLVAWLKNAVGTWEASMPPPLSVMRISFLPPSAISTVTAVAPASMAVFYKLLHNGGRTFYHLAGRDLINGMFV